MRVSIRGPKEGSVPLVANEICKAHGFTLDNIESRGGQVSYLRRLPGARMPDVEKGETDAIFDEAVRQWVDRGAVIGMRFLEPSDEALAKLEVLGLRRGVVLQSDFPNLLADFKAVDFSGFPVFTNEAVPDEQVRALCAALEARSFSLCERDCCCRCTERRSGAPPLAGRDRVALGAGRRWVKILSR